MKSRITLGLVGLLVLAATFDGRGQDVLISEIMYHPSSESPLEEYIELWNVGATNVNVSGWRLTGGIEFTLPANTTIAAGRHLVIAANRARFQAKYPGAGPVVGDFAVVRVIDAWEIPGTNYVNILSNRRNRITLEDATSNVVDSVTYADEGDWATRQRGLPSPGAGSPNRGWTWYAPHDGLGRSLELVNPRMPNEYGQNWMSSATLQGTPGQTNSVFSTNIPPLILDVIHAPLVPRSTDNVSVTARVLDERAESVTVALRYRVDSLSPGEFLSVPMLDDGQNNDGAANDGVYGARLGLLPHRTIIEFYVEARDAENNVRTWPAPAIDASDRGFAPLGQVANALFQVDDTTYNLTAPLYKLTLTAAETQELANMLASNPQSDAQMNATFLSLDGEGAECRYLIGVRNRGHGSRSGNPHNYRLGFVSDAPWKGVSALNLNARTVHAQHFGSTIALKSGAAGNYSRSVVLRINIDATPGGTPNLGRYAANEVLDGDWAARHFPNDSEGNIYKVIRDIDPPNFNYRGTDPNQYRNTYFKESNVSEDDWADLIGMLAVMGENTTDTFTPENVYRVINVEQWLLHLAVMNLLGNNESGLNTGNNDDYYMYRGVNDPRFILLYHDLDQILGQGGSLAADADIFRATCCPISGDTEGSWRAMARFLRSPDYEPIYYRTLQRLLDTTFAETNFNALLDQTLGDYVSVNTINAMKNWMNQRRAYVQGVIAPFVTPVPRGPVATVSGAPRSPTPFTTATLIVGGSGITHYRFRLNNGALGPETPVSTPIVLNNLPHGSSNVVRVIGRNAAGVWQAQTAFSLSRPWIVNTNWPAVRLNEVLARNDGAVNHHGTFPDLIELFNEGSAPLDLAGLRLSDDPAQPDKFVFPPNTVVPGGGYLVVYADDEDNMPGLHTGFALNGDGEGVYLFAAGGGSLLDSVTFGPQVSNLSLGRHGSGDWMLGAPTPGASNQVQAMAAPTMLRINEWLAIGSDSTPTDFVELYNTAADPVSLDGLYLTDQPIGAPRQHAVAPLSFVGGRSALALLADGRPEQGPTHLNFGLAGEQGEIAVLDGAGNVIDCVIYGPQQRGVSMGRCPDGGIGVRAFALLTPGIGNVCPAAPAEPIVVNLIRITNAWKYEQTANLDGVPWKTREFNDAAWPSGPGLLGVKVATHTLPEPVLTPLQVAQNRITFYFRHHFQVPAGASFTSLEFRHVVDDGAAFYLNGVEVGPRFNLSSVPAPNPIPYSALAETTRAAAYQGPFPISASLLVPGDNVFAVEVHQNAPNSADIIMGLTLDGVIVTNDPAAAGIVLNEVLANNVTTTELDGRTPDWIEVYNPSQAPVDL
ncbi:MAG TPA: lamin tail domain-containing protein, partial [Methylomirabilota bacterium]|nr:lamin tail domain-containing protein [Methylomirabilota bacterium]